MLRGCANRSTGIVFIRLLIVISRGEFIDATYFPVD